MFPKVTYDWEEFCRWTSDPESYGIMKDYYNGIYASKDCGYIWLSKPSIKFFLHEFGHHIGYKLELSIKWHSLIETIF